MPRADAEAMERHCLLAYSTCFLIDQDFQISWAVVHTPLISAPGMQRQEDLCVFEVSLVYRVSSRTGC